MGVVRIQFSDLAAPYIFWITAKLLYVEIKRTLNDKIWHTMIMLLIEAKRFREIAINIEGMVEESSKSGS